MNILTHRPFCALMALALACGSLPPSAHAATVQYNATSSNTSIPESLQDTANNQFTASTAKLTNEGNYNTITFSANSSANYTYSFFGMRIACLNVLDLQKNSRDYTLSAYSPFGYGRTIIFVAEGDQDAKLQINENFAISLAAATDMEVRRTIELKSDVVAKIAAGKSLSIQAQFVGDSTFIVTGGGTMVYENISLNSTASTSNNWLVTGGSTLDVSSNALVEQASLADTLGSGELRLIRGTISIANGDSLSNKLILSRKGAKNINTSTANGSFTLDNTIVFAYESGKLTTLNLGGANISHGKKLHLDLSCLASRSWKPGESVTLFEQVASFSGNNDDIAITGPEGIIITINEDGTVTATPNPEPEGMSNFTIALSSSLALLALAVLMLIRRLKSD